MADARLLDHDTRLRQSILDLALELFRDFVGVAAQRRLSFDVRIDSGHTVTYKGEMLKRGAERDAGN